MMFTNWKCDDCNLLNYPSWDNCPKCFKKAVKPFDHIMNQQKSLFDGFMRMEILNNLSNNELTKIISMDIINLCTKFFVLEMESLMIEHKELLLEDNANSWLKLAQTFKDKQEAELYILTTLGLRLRRLQNGDNSFIAYLLLKQLVIITNKDNPTCLNALGLVQREWIGIKHETLATFQRAIELQPNDPILRFNYALCYEDNKQFGLAIEQYKKGQEMDPFDPDFALQIGACYKQMNEYEKAKLYMIKAESMDSDNSIERHNKYAAWFKDIDEYELAIAQYEKAIKLSPDDAVLLTRCGMCCRWLMAFDRAKEYYLQAIEMEPENGILHSEYADFVAIELKDYALAKIHFDKAMELIPEHGEMYYDYARMLRWQGKEYYEESEKYYRKALSMMNVNERIVNGSFSYLLYLMDKMDEAKKYINIQLELEKKNRNPSYFTWFYYGLITEDENDKEEVLKKAVGLINTKPAYDDSISAIPGMIENEVKNVQYLERFKQMLDDKFNNVTKEIAYE